MKHRLADLLLREIGTSPAVDGRHRQAAWAAAEALTSIRMLFGIDGQLRDIEELSTLTLAKTALVVWVIRTDTESGGAAIAFGTREAAMDHGRREIEEYRNNSALADKVDGYLLTFASQFFVKIDNGDTVEMFATSVR